MHCMCKQQNFAINFLDFIVKRKIKYCNKYTVIIEIWIWYAVWWNEKIVSNLYLKEPIAYTENDYIVKNVYTCTWH